MTKVPCFICKRKVATKNKNVIAVACPDCTTEDNLSSIIKSLDYKTFKHMLTIKEESPKKKDASVREIKLKIKALKAERETALENNDLKMADIYRRRISRLKKKTRRAA